MIGIGLIGFGHWGPNLARTLAGAGARLVAIADLRPERLRAAAALHPGAALCEDWRELLQDPRIDALVVATPPSTHFAIALACLQSGRHALVEKPMTTVATEAARLVEEAARRELVLMVDHTFLYTAGIQAIRRLLVEGTLGEPFGYDAIRVGPWPANTDVDAVWDLAAHDIAVMDYLFGRRPVAVTASRSARAKGARVEEATLTFDFGGGLLGQIEVGWLSPVKLRRAVVAGSLRSAVFDDRDPLRRLRIFDHATPGDVAGLLAGRASDSRCPPLSSGEPLAGLARDFVASIADGGRPLSGGELGLRVVQVLEVATASARQGGRMLRLA